MRRFLLIVNLVACTPTRATPDATASAPTNVASAALIDDAGVDAEAAKLEAEADAMQIRMLEALGDASNIGSSDLKIRANGPISGGTGLAGLGGQKDAGPTPMGRVTMGAVTSVPTIPNAERTVVGLRAHARSCYIQGLLRDAGMSGVVSVTLAVDVRGEVSSAFASANDGGSINGTVVSCIKRAFNVAQFDAPPSPAKLTVSLTLSPGP